MLTRKKIYYKNFGTFLKSQYRQRKMKNEAYSLRAFARFLQISPSLLSDYMSGKKDPRLKNKSGILKKLGIQENQLEFFTQDMSKDLYKELSSKEFSILSHWKCFAILETMRLIDFQPNVKWIAIKLGLKVSEIKVGINQLEKAGFLKISENGTWLNTAPEFMTNVSSDASLRANLEYQDQVLSLARLALHQHAWKNHDQKSMLFAIQLKDLPEIVERIRIFSRSLSSEFTHKSDLDSVYQLSISFYPLSLIDENK